MLKALHQSFARQKAEHWPFEYPAMCIRPAIHALLDFVAQYPCQVTRRRANDGASARALCEPLRMQQLRAGKKR